MAGEIMISKRYSDGSMKLHIDDVDDYTITDDNGVDVWLKKADVDRIRSTP